MVQVPPQKRLGGAVIESRFAKNSLTWKHRLVHFDVTLCLSVDDLEDVHTVSAQRIFHCTSYRKTQSNIIFILNPSEI